jgi:O-antigen biosynthesis protein
MRLSVIVPAFNHLDLLLLCLYTLRACAYDKRTIQYLVQDDASPEYDVTSVVQPELASVARNESNLGFVSSTNTCVRRSHGDIIFIVNQDVFAIWGWSDPWDLTILRAFENPAIGVIGTKLLFPQGMIQSVGGAFDAKCQPYHPLLGSTDFDAYRVRVPQQVSWTTGAALATRRFIWDRLGGFDKAYGKGYFEDVDYCLKVQQLGYRIWYEAQCTLFHKTGCTRGFTGVSENAKLFRSRWANIITPECDKVMANFW